MLCVHKRRCVYSHFHQPNNENSIMSSFFFGDENRSGNLIFHNVRQWWLMMMFSNFFSVLGGRRGIIFIFFLCFCWENKRKLNISFRFLWARQKYFKSKIRKLILNKKKEILWLFQPILLWNSIEYIKTFIEFPYHIF